MMSAHNSEDYSYEQHLYGLARSDLATYFALARGFEPAAHQVRILATVQAFLEECWSRPPSEHDGLRVLNINLPPGAGKSAIISATLPAWDLGRRPFERIGIVSAKGDLADMFELTTKVDIESGEVYASCFPEEDARPDKSRGWAKGKLYVKGLPKREITPSIAAQGLFGSILGKRFTLIILDDPQDQETAATPGMRKKVWEFINGTVLSRGVPGCPVICVQQRLHEDDVSGNLVKHYDAKSVEVSALNPDGTSYWPEMYSAKFLLQKRRADPHLFESWYQQRPGQGEGSIFKREWMENTYEGTPPEGDLYQSWDTALKAGQENDFSAHVDAVVTNNQDIYLTDFDWQRLEFPELIDEMERIGERKPRCVLVEDKVSGTSAIQVTKKQTSLPIVEVQPERDKVARAKASTGWLESGKVFFPAHHPKLAEFQAFLTGFPLATHDDPVDAYTQLVNYVIAQIKIPEPYKSRKGASRRGGRR